MIIRVGGIYYRFSSEKKLQKMNSRPSPITTMVVYDFLQRPSALTGRFCMGV